MKVTTLLFVTALYVTVGAMIYAAKSRVEADLEPSKLHIACDHNHKAFRDLGYECR